MSDADYQEPVAWAVGYGGAGGHFTDDDRKAASWRDAGSTVTPLYCRPQPALTDGELALTRVALRKSIFLLNNAGRGVYVDAIGRLLAMLGGEE